MRILITGASGNLGHYLCRAAVRAGHQVVAWSHTSADSIDGIPPIPVDLTNPAALASAWNDARPDVVIHAAALASLDACARAPEQAWRLNVHATEDLASRARRLIYLSTDLVFAGDHPPYAESDPPNPLSLYGRSKAVGELTARASSSSLVVRLSLLFGLRASPTKPPNFFEQQLEALRNGSPMTLFEDEWRTPICASVAASALIALAESNTTGILHLGGPERMSRWEMGLRLAQFLGRDARVFHPTRRSDMPGDPRPADVSLNSSPWRKLFPRMHWPNFEEALQDLLLDP